MRITKNIFTDLAIFMIGFGLVVGIVFPFFMVMMKIPTSYIFTFGFVISCIVAGVFVGAMNILIAKSVVGTKVRLLSEKMHFIGEKIRSAKTLADLQECDSAECRIVVDSEDELGESAQSFNTLIEALSGATKSDAAIREFNTLMSSKLELDSLAKAGLDYILEHLEANGGCIVLEKGGEFFIPYSFGLKETTNILENENLWKLFEKRKVEKINISQELALDALVTSFRPQEVVVIPLLYKEVPLGLLIIASSKEINYRLLDSLEILTQSFVIALNNAITYDQLQKLAANDPLTGLYNRRFGLSRLSEEFSRSVRTKIPLGILMFDIDHFKKVNDTYGHAVGDRVLVNVAKISTMACRKGDFVIRYGGEEFIMILPGAGREDCLFIAERVRHMVEESIVQIGQTSIKVTVSVGAVSYPEFSVDNEHDLTEAADKALYRAKEQGRNVVVAAF
jgi:two-component system cell cycle response regulator